MINIDDLLGVPYKTNGRSKYSGFDCYGLAIEVSKRFGHEIPDIEKAREKDYDFDECQKLVLKKIKVKEIETPQTEGDIVLITQLNGAFTHIGIYLGNDLIIHCDRRGVRVEKQYMLKGMIGRVYKWL
jgi:cell wall-associated NlpC family hydrolase